MIVLMVCNYHCAKLLTSNEAMTGKWLKDGGSDSVDYAGNSSDPNSYAVSQTGFFSQ